MSTVGGAGKLVAWCTQGHVLGHEAAATVLLRLWRVGGSAVACGRRVRRWAGSGDAWVEVAAAWWRKGTPSHRAPWPMRWRKGTKWTKLSQTDISNSPNLTHIILWANQFSLDVP